jgi:hypothetical protein
VHVTQRPKALQHCPARQSPELPQTLTHWPATQLLPGVQSALAQHALAEH